MPGHRTISHLPCAAQDHLEYANYGSLLGLALWQLPRCSIFRNELETCPNRHRYYREALFLAIADAVWPKRQPECLLLALSGQRRAVTII
jgi:hypothetical protein